jgi:hypothetical protein
MGRLGRRVGRLEARPSHTRLTPEQERQRWIRQSEAWLREETRDWQPSNQGEDNAYDIFCVLRSQGRLPSTFEGARDQILAWGPPPPRRVVERVLARQAYEYEEGAEDFVIPPEWRESFEAADELRARLAEVPDDVCAQWIVALYEGNDLAEEVEREQKQYGIMPGMQQQAIGPDLEEISQEEYDRRSLEIFGELHAGERAYDIYQHVYKLMKERSNDG